MTQKYVRSPIVASILALLVALPAMTSRARADDPVLRLKVETLKTAHVKLRKTFTAAKLVAGPAPLALKTLAADAGALGAAARDARVLAGKAGAKDDVLAKFDGVDGESQRLAAKAFALADEKLSKSDVKAFTTLMTTLQADLSELVTLTAALIER